MAVIQMIMLSKNINLNINSDPYILRVNKVKFWLNILPSSKYQNPPVYFITKESNTSGIISRIQNTAYIFEIINFEKLMFYNYTPMQLHLSLPLSDFL